MKPSGRLDSLSGSLGVNSCPDPSNSTDYFNFGNGWPKRTIGCAGWELSLASPAGALRDRIRHPQRRYR